MIKIRCSSLERYFNCSHFLKYPDACLPTSTFAAAGTELHKIAEKTILDGSKPPGAILNYVEYIRALINRSSHYGLEKSFLARLDDNITLTGSLDFFCIDDEGNAAVCDLKTGTDPVPPYSPQLLGYGLLIKDNFPDVKSMTSTVYQFGQAYSVDITELLEDTREQIIERAEYIDSPDAGKWCGWCPALLECQEVKRIVKRLSERVKHKIGIYKNE